VPLGFSLKGIVAIGDVGQPDAEPQGWGRAREKRLLLPLYIHFHHARDCHPDTIHWNGVAQNP